MKAQPSRYSHRATVRARLWACVSLIAFSLSGCGYGLRGEVGPTWIQGEGFGATTQVTGLLPVLAGSGLVDHWQLGGWATMTARGTTGGLLFGTEIAILPGGVDRPRSEPRRGLGGGGRFQPRFGTEHRWFGGGFALVHGSGETTDTHMLGGGRGDLVSFDWRDVAVRSFGGAFHVSRDVTDGLAHPGAWRIDGFVLAEWLKAAD